MAISNDLFMAILAMDSYNRGYNRGLNVTGNEIGAVNLGDSDDSTEAQAVSFFAQSYTVNDNSITGLTSGQKVISYRGTDNPNPFNFASDFWTGWTVGAGYSGAAQAVLARDFYEQVMDEQSVFAPAGTNIVLTGHSLGGGLAGYISTLSGAKAVGFDHMPFGQAAIASFISEFTRLAPGEDFTPERAEALGLRLPTASNFNGFFTEGEINLYLRNGSIAIALGALLGEFPGSGPFLNALGQSIAYGQSSYEANVSKTELSTFGWGAQWTSEFVSFDRHSQSLLITLMYASEEEEAGRLTSAWRDNDYAVKLINALYSVDIGKALGWEQGVTGQVDESDQMRRALAYSAIDVGTRVFGDAGIRTMFKDAEEFGGLLRAESNPSNILKEAGDAVAMIIVQFAGQLATSKVLMAEYPAITDGIVTVASDKTLLTVHLDDEFWSIGSGSPPDDIVGKQKLVDSLLASTHEFIRLGPSQFQSNYPNNIGTGMRWLWDDDTPGAIDRVEVGAKNSSLERTIADRGALTDLTKVVFFAASNLNDKITGSNYNDFIVGGDGDDTLRSDEAEAHENVYQRDFLAGGRGNDTLIGGLGHDFITGGDGNDIIIYEPIDGVNLGVTLDLIGVTDSIGIMDEKILEVRVTGYANNVDRILGVEKMELTDHPDTIVVDRRALESEMTIDMGESDRSGATWATNLDTVDLSNVGEGITYNNGRVVVGTGAWATIKSSTNLLSESLKFKNVEHVILTPQNDVFVGAEPNATLLETGEGQDRVWVSPLVGVADLSPEDRVSFFGLFDLYGGLRYKWSESQYATSWGGLVRWGVNHENELQVSLPWLSVNVNGQSLPWDMYILNYGSPAEPGPKPGNIFLYDVEITVYDLYNANNPSNASWLVGWLDLAGAILKTHYGVKAFGNVDPLTLDLDGDGLELVYRSSVSPHFDMDGDLYAERSGWVRSDDGILARDLNGNGKIDDITEMFGGTESGFEALARLDGNEDGKIDSSDNGLADFDGDGDIDANDTIASLKIWRDLNQNGVTDPGELSSLGDNNIVSISVDSTPSVNTFNQGNQITATATFTRADGTISTIADVSYRVDNIHTTYTGGPITITTAAAALPELKAYGTLVSLHQAMSLDDSFRATVAATLPNLSSFDLDDLRQAALPILVGWAQASPLGDGDRDPNTNAPRLKPHNDIHILVIDGPLGRDQVIDFAYQKEGTPQEWALASGMPILDENEDVIVHPTLAQVLASPQTTGHWSLLDGDFISFAERFTGESIPLDMLQPSGTTSIIGALPIFTSILNMVDLAVVRIAVQGGPNSSYFESISYDAENNNFHAAQGNARELIPVFEAIFDTVKTENYDAAWVGQWKPILDVVIGDYVRNGAYLQNTYGFLAHNIVAAYENIEPAPSFFDLATALGIPAEILVTGSGTLTGSENADIFYGGASNDTMVGGVGPDTYIFGREIGHDVIDDVEHQLIDVQLPDTLRFAHLTPSEVVTSRDGIDFILTVAATEETIRIVGQFTGQRLFGGMNFADDRGVGEIVFADGTVWGAIEIAKSLRDPQPTSDTLVGTEAIDFLDGGAGNDTLIGGGAADLYFFDRGYDHDRIEDYASYVTMDGPDIVIFGPGITKSDVSFHRDGDSRDLLIKIEDSDDQLTIFNQFWAANSVVAGIKFLSQMDMFFFSDGSFYLPEEIREILISNSETTGDDTIYGFDGEDVLDGGSGNDYLNGGNGNDIYIFGTGYGDDTILESSTNITLGTDDTVRFTADVLPDDVLLTLGPGLNDIKIIIQSTGDSLTILQQNFEFVFGPYFDVDRFEFFDGTVWTEDDVRAKILEQAKTSGDDVIHGFFSADTLDGGAGNDVLFGHGGGDTFIYGGGYGNDVIDASYDVYSRNLPDRVLFNADIAPEDLTISRVGESDDLTLTIAGTGETLTIKNQFSGDPDAYLIFPTFGLVEEFIFFDETTWMWSDIQSSLLTSNSTSGNDLLVGYSSDDTLDGGAGDDILKGRMGDDVYIFGRGYGRDTIIDDDQSGFFHDSAPDRIRFNSDVELEDLEFVRAGDDLVIRIRGTEDQLTVIGHFNDDNSISYFEFANEVTLTFEEVQAIIDENPPGTITHLGTAAGETIQGSWRDDVIYGRAGDDTLNGGHGNDTYLFNAGDGNDAVSDLGGTDTLQLGSGLTAANVMFYVSGYHLLISDGTTGDQIKLLNQYIGVGNEIETLVYGDGTSISLTGGLPIVGTDENDTISGTPYSDILWGLEGNDTLNGGNGGNDTFFGGAGNDTLNGSWDDDLLNGGTGNDTLNGGNGNDSYVFNAGDGNDVIYDLSGSDTLQLGSDLTSTNVRFIISGYNLLIVDDTAGDQIRISDQYLGTGRELETLIYGDGTSINLTGGLPIIGTTGNDSLEGTSHNDTLRGLAGTDTLNGGAGNDTYVFNAGDGNDTINENWAASTSDVLQLGSGLIASNVTFNVSGNDLLITDGTAGDQIRIVNQYHASTNSRIETLVYGDGTSIDLTSGLSIVGTTGNDTLNGTTANDTLSGLEGDDALDGGGGSDTLIGGIGNDTITGGADNDTYLFNAGDGNDTINENWGASTNDVLQLGAGLVLTNVTFTVSGNDLLITDGTAGDQIRIINQYHTWTDSRIETLVYGDGMTISLAGGLPIVGTVGNDVLNGTSTDDTLYGLSGNDTLSGAGGADTLIGGAGNDTLNGGAGNDTYVFNAGDGNDTINEDWANSSADVLQLGAGLTASNVTFNVSGNDLLITNDTAGDQIRIVNQFHFWPDFQIETLVYGDGTSVSLTSGLPIVGTVNNDTLNGTPNNDTLQGLAGNDVINGNDGADSLDGGTGDDTLDGGAGNDALAGAAGNDTLIGAGGNDTYLYNAGDGNDTINENWGASTNDVLQLGAGLVLTNVAFTVSGNDLLITDGTAGDQIRIVNQYHASTDSRIESLVYSDGMTIDLTGGLPIVGTSGNDVLNAPGSNDVLYGLAGNDTLSGNGGADTLIGGIGNDMLYGGAGNDTYTFSAGDGNDTINEDWANSSGDVLKLGSGLTASNVTFNVSGNDLLISNDTAGDQIRIVNQFHFWPDFRIETLVYGDGSSIDITAGLAFVGTSGNDALNGTGYADTLNGLAGNDTLIGNVGDDTLVGGAGNDTLYGGAGNDTYSFNAGDGNDTINEDWANTTGDVIRLGTGLTAANVTFTVSGNDLLITNDTAGDQIRIVNQYHFWPDFRIESLVYGDGTTISLTSGTPVVGSAGNDSLVGSSGNDALYGLDGSDSLTGGSGSDHFGFNAPTEGMDHIIDFSTAQGDMIDVLGSAFGGLSTGTLSSSLFSSNVDGTFSNGTQRFAFDQTSHTLYYDADGSGGGSSAIALAVLENAANLANTDIRVV